MVASGKAGPTADPVQLLRRIQDKGVARLDILGRAAMIYSMLELSS